MFLYTTLVERAVEDIARTVAPLAHIDPRRVLVISEPRTGRSRHGRLAQCYALGEEESQDFAYWYNRTTREVVQATAWWRRENTRVLVEGRRMLYVVSLRLPRLLNHDPSETIVHELVHISPDFDGRFRRLRHGRRFDVLVEECLRTWRSKGDQQLVEATAMGLRTALERWGTPAARCFGSPFVTPRVLPLENPPRRNEHPDFRRKGLRYDPGRVRIVEARWTPDDVPAVLTECDFVYRVFSTTGARRISAAAVLGAGLDEMGLPRK